MTRPSASRNWYEPGASGIVPGSGRADHAPIVAARRTGRRPTGSAWRRRRALCSSNAGPVSGATYQAPRPTTPRCGDQAVTRRPMTEPYPVRGGPTCCDSRLRCRTATPSRPPTSSTPASPPPRPTLGDRLLILGHHYQRDEVIRWADAGGDSFKLARFAADNAPGDRHRVLRRALHGRVGRRAHRRPPAGDPPRPQRRLLDGRHGRHRPGRGGVGGDRPRSPTIDRVVPITYMNSSAALKAFVGEHGGAVCTSSNARAVLEWALGRGDKVLFFPDQHLGRNTGFDDGLRRSRHARVEPAPRARRPRGARRQGSDAACCGRATARCTSASGPSTSRRPAPSTPTSR